MLGRGTPDRVFISPPERADLDRYATAVRLSASRLLPFAVPDERGLEVALGRQSAEFCTFLIRAKDPAGFHGLVGRVNVAGIIGGRYRGATIGYDAFDPYAGRGLFSEGLAQVLAACFTAAPNGLGLHRIEANVQPANQRSARVLRRLGFAREGFSPDYLWLPMHQQPSQETWQAHDRYALLASEWAGSPRPAAPRLAALVTRSASGSSSQLARLLAVELQLPLLRSSLLGASVWEVLRDSPPGAVVELIDRAGAAGGLQSAGFDPDRVPVIHDSGPAPSHDELLRLSLMVRAAAC